MVSYASLEQNDTAAVALEEDKQALELVPRRVAHFLWQFFSNGGISGKWFFKKKKGMVCFYLSFTKIKSSLVTY